ncbi:MAG TPA: O-antigen ligase family protein [Solirubrobacteraceae bacterium]|nr:O-antigen ligase family protein [Solirubrobacteraceae bacterium]
MSVPAPTLAATLPGPGTIVAGSIGALLAIVALSLLMRRRPDALPLLAIAALPFRLPISADGRTVNLLIPLYLVVAAGTVTFLLPRWLGLSVKGSCNADGCGDRRPQQRMQELATGSPTKMTTWLSPTGLERLLLVAVVLYALQGVYSADHAKAAENVAFFYIPFGLLFMLLRDVRWTRELVLRCLALAVALAVVFAGIGFVEYARKQLFLNPKVVVANEYGNYFRVNSLFFDPNIYGRFLAIVMIALTAVVLWSARRRDVLIGAGVLGWLLAGLVTSFSQSSIAALLLGLAVLAAYRWDVRATVYVAGALVAIAAVVVLSAPPSLHFGLNGSGGSTSNATSGRTKLISGGLELFADRPLYGYGAGSFETEYRRHGHARDAANATSASHAIPITVAAEQGIIGLAVYIALLFAAFATLFRGAGRSPPTPKQGDTRLWLASPVRPALAACLAALVLHTWTYADFLEDPVTWTLLGIGVALARTRDFGWVTREPVPSATAVGAGHGT